MNLLTLCGSLRARSSNKAMLRATGQVAAERGIAVCHWESLAELPHFNPDHDNESLPPSVARLRSAVSGADCVVLSTPEYAHALPGAFKNALDWLVSDPAIAGKPVAIVYAERGSRWAVDSLCEVLRTLSARIPEGAVVGLALGSNDTSEDAILGRPELRAGLVRCLDALAGGGENVETRKSGCDR